MPWHLKGLLALIPTPPAAWDGSKGRSIKYPILGNNQYGDCYYADMCHCVQTFTGNGSGMPVAFDVNAVTARYKQLSGGDNGLGDDQVFPEWKGGIVGPSGPHKILDDMTVHPDDDAAIRLGMWLFCGCSYTASLLNTWLQNPQPGQVWDADGRPDPSAGHAMHLSGYDQTYYYDETWSLDPAIKLTPAGLKASDPEITVQFSLEMFNSQGIAPHNGMSYVQLATLWVQLGGASLPPSPFPPAPLPPPPVPPLPPVPTPPSVWDWLMSLLKSFEQWLVKLFSHPVTADNATVLALAIDWVAIFKAILSVLGKGMFAVVSAWLTSLSLPTALISALLAILQGLLGA